MKTYVLYHGNCPDGFGAALVAWLRFGPDAEYIPVSYGKPPPAIETGSTVYIVDFSYPRETLIGLHKESHWLQVLDHHATAEKELEGLLYCLFDMDKSGAVLAWEHFYPGISVPEFFLYLQDRDLWRFKLPQSREVSCALRSYPMDFATWQRFSGVGQGFHEAEWIGIEQLKAEGVACLRLTQQQVDNMAKHHRWAYLDTKSKKISFTQILDPGGNGDPMVPPHIQIVPVSNATVFFSEVGERLLEMYPAMDCAAYYTDRPDGKRQWGLRSRPSFDCSVIAKAFGGGGHKQASGFVV